MRVFRPWSSPFPFPEFAAGFLAGFTEFAEFADGFSNTRRDALRFAGSIR
jgi:hypothetical protein